LEAPAYERDGRSVRVARRARDRPRGQGLYVETDLDNDIAVEIFLLGPARTDISGFEEADEAAEAQD
jgi:hypothetical protein